MHRQPPHVTAEDDGVVRRSDIEADNILQLLGEFRIVGEV
jgi:hypothetical protein